MRVFVEVLGSADREVERVYLKMAFNGIRTVSMA